MSDEEDYFPDQRSWANGAASAERRSKKIAWIVATVTLVLAGMQALALILLLPLKNEELVPVLVDRTTGYTQILDPDGAQRLQADEALIQSLLAQFVTSRERLDPHLVNSDYRKAALWSSGSAKEQYISAMSRSNPNSPIHGLDDRSTQHVRIKSVSQMSPGFAMVRFDTTEIDLARIEHVTGSWIATIKFEFYDGAMSFDDRLLNPMGLQVTSYRRDAERMQVPEVSKNEFSSSEAN